MKSLLTFLIILFLGGTVYAQQDDVYQFNGDNQVNYFSNQKSGGFFIGLEFDYAEIERSDAAFAGLKLGYVHNHRLDIGIAGKGFFSEFNKQRFGSSPITLTGGYGGLYVSPHIGGRNKVHLAVPLLIGGGAVGYINESVEDILERGDDHVEDWDMILVAEPGLDVIFSISRSFQLEIGGSYRFVNNADLRDLPEVDLEGFSAGLTLKFGML